LIWVILPTKLLSSSPHRFYDFQGKTKTRPDLRQVHITGRAQINSNVSSPSRLILFEFLD